MNINVVSVYPEPKARIRVDANNSAVDSECTRDLTLHAPFFQILFKVFSSVFCFVFDTGVKHAFYW